MTENGKSQIQTIGGAMLGFVLVVGLGAAALMSHGGSAKAPSQASRPSAIPAAPAAEPVVPAFTPSSSSLPVAPAGATLADVSSPAPALPPVSKGSDRAAPAAAAPRPAALVVTRHLEATQTTSAKASVAAAPVAKKMAPLPTREFVTPKLVDPKNGSIASSVHYGVSNRSELMGRAAGPVYNFKGRGAKKTDVSGANIGAPVTTRMEETRKQVENSSLDEKAKKDLRERFQLVNDSMGKAGSN